MAQKFFDNEDKNREFLRYLDKRLEGIEISLKTEIDVKIKENLNYIKNVEAKYRVIEIGIQHITQRIDGMDIFIKGIREDLIEFKEFTNQRFDNIDKRFDQIDIKLDKILAKT